MLEQYVHVLSLRSVYIHVCTCHCEIQCSAVRYMYMHVGVHVMYVPLPVHDVRYSTCMFSTYILEIGASINVRCPWTYPQIAVNQALVHDFIRSPTSTCDLSWFSDVKWRPWAPNKSFDLFFQVFIRRKTLSNPKIDSHFVQILSASRQLWNARCVNIVDCKSRGWGNSL